MKKTFTQNISLTKQSKERLHQLCKKYDMCPSEIVRYLINKEFTLDEPSFQIVR